MKVVHGNGLQFEQDETITFVYMRALMLALMNIKCKHCPHARFAHEYQLYKCKDCDCTTYEPCTESDVEIKRVMAMDLDGFGQPPKVW